MSTRVCRAAIVMSLFVALLSMPNLVAVPLITNGDFESGLASWSTTGTVAVTNFSGGFYSPSGDNSYFARIVSNPSQFNSTLFQTIDMPCIGDYRLTMDFTLLTEEPSWGDDFRAELWIDFLGGGPFTPVFSIGSGDGGFQPIAPGSDIKYYTRQNYTYDFAWNNADEDLVLRFLVLGYSPDDDKSMMLLDNVGLSCVPEPSTLLLFGTALGALPLLRRKQR